MHQAWKAEVTAQATNRAQKIFLHEGICGRQLSISTTEEWLDVFNGQVLDPPWEFCQSEPVSYNNNTASNALRSVIYAKYILDVDALNGLTDDEYVNSRNAIYDLPSELLNALAEAMLPGMIGANHTTVLLVGHHAWGGHEYVYYLVRGSHAESPQENQYMFDHISFRKDPINNKYWETPDLDLSLIRSFLRLRTPTPHGLRSANYLGTYQEMYEYYKDSGLPVHFYTFGE